MKGTLFGHLTTDPPRYGMEIAGQRLATGG